MSSTGFLKDNMTLLIDSEKLSEAVSRLAKEVNIDYHGKELVLVAPLKGSCLLVADLARQLSINHVWIDFVYLNAMSSHGPIQVHKDISVNIADKYVLVVEEIIDTGRTLSFLLDRLRQSHPASVKVLTLLDKPARREIPLKPNYIGLTIDDRYVVGYGMDSEEKGRNYKGIYSFKM